MFPSTQNKSTKNKKRHEIVIFVIAGFRDFKNDGRKSTGK